jgi:hypothetical protein
MKLFAFAALASTVSGHVRLVFEPAAMSIRNAAGESANGKYSTNGPCGGVQTFGANGINTVTAGDSVTLKIAYNGGHKSDANAFKLAFACGRPDNDGVLRNEQTPNDLGVATVPAADSSTTGYDLTFTVPPAEAGVNGQYCTVSALDQRNWGGCVDMMIQAPGVPPTPAPGPVVLKSMEGSFELLAADSASAQSTCDADSPSCCCLGGSVTVSHTAGQEMAEADFTVAANDQCTTEIPSGTYPITLRRQSDKVNGVKGDVRVGGQDFEISVFDNGVLILTNVDDNPSICSAEVMAMNDMPIETGDASATGPLAALTASLLLAALQ